MVWPYGQADSLVRARMCEGMQNGRRSRLGPSWNDMSRANGLAWALQWWAMSQANGIVRANVVWSYGPVNGLVRACVWGVSRRPNVTFGPLMAWI